MKILIRKDQTNGYWKARVEDWNEWFLSFEAAAETAGKIYKRFYKENAAYSMVCNIAVNMLALKDQGIVRKLILTKCKGITKKQYGYIKGLHERQEREW